MDTNWTAQTHKMASGYIIPDLGRRGIFFIFVVKTKAFMSFAVTVKLICVCVFLRMLKAFFHGAAHMSCHDKICFQTRSDTNQAVHLHSQ